MGDKLRKHQQGRQKKGKTARQLIKGALTSQVTTGHLGLNPRGNPTQASELLLYLSGVGAINLSSCRLWVEGHSRGGRVMFILWHFLSAIQVGRRMSRSFEHPQAKKCDVETQSFENVVSARG